MNSNFKIVSNKSALLGYQIATIDAITLREFYEELAEELSFPDYFGFNLDSLDECLNDLSWIENKKIAIYISDSANFLATERNPEKLETLLDQLDATCEDWHWVDEDDEIPQKELIIAFSESERIKSLLADLGIDFD
jgi:RNAse (barnase) inhibitor barstar